MGVLSVSLSTIYFKKKKKIVKYFTVKGNMVHKKYLSCSSTFENSHCKICHLKVGK